MSTENSWGVPQGTVLGPILFKTCQSDVCQFENSWTTWSTSRDCFKSNLISPCQNDSSVTFGIPWNWYSLNLLKNSAMLVEVFDTLSHTTLAVTSGYCFVEISKHRLLTFPHIAYGFIAAHNAIAVWQISGGNPEIVEKLFAFTAYAQRLLPLPCFTTTVWIESGCRKYLSYTWTAIAAVPLALYFEEDFKTNLTVWNEIFMLLDVVALDYVALIKRNWLAIGTGLVYFTAHFAMGRSSMFNYTLSLFCFMSMSTLVKFWEPPPDDQDK